MKISFDLDDTLILTDKDAVYEKPVKHFKAFSLKRKASGRNKRIM